MRKIKISLTACLVLIYFVATAQGERLSTKAKEQRRPFKYDPKIALKVGDKVPNVLLPSIVKYKKQSAKLMSEFGGKPIILDLWNLECESCIAMMPENDALQKQFAGQINILLLNNWGEPANDIASFFDRTRYVKNTSLPSTAGPGEINHLFPGPPYRVWIDKNGIIKAISNDPITKQNIVALINDTTIPVEPYKQEMDDVKDYVRQTLMSTVDETLNKGVNLKQYTYMSGYDTTQNGIRFSESFSQYYGPLEKSVGVGKRNATILELYCTAYYGLQDPFSKKFFLPYQMIFETRDSLKYKVTGPEDPNGKSKLFCYQLRLEGKTLDVGYRYMQIDLDRFFNVKSSLEKRKFKVYVLKRLNLSNTLTTRGGLSEERIVGTLNQFNNKSWFDVMHYITPFRYLFDSPLEKSTFKSYLKYQLIDQTGFDSKMLLDINIPVISAWDNIEKVNQTLANYGLVVTMEERYLDAIVLKDTGI